MSNDARRVLAKRLLDRARAEDAAAGAVDAQVDRTGLDFGQGLDERLGGNTAPKLGRGPIIDDGVIQEDINRIGRCLRLDLEPAHRRGTVVGQQLGEQFHGAAAGAGADCC